MSEYDLAIVGGRVYACTDGTLSSIPRGVVATRGAEIAYVGTDAHFGGRAKRTIDATGRFVLPGLCDPHTHLVFGGNRIDEFARKMAGESYQLIAQNGGGIMSTVRATRAASDDQLFDSAKVRALQMRAHGVTTIEIKSGYGLTIDHELRLLRVARRLGREGIVRTHATLLGAHTVPEERRGDRAGYLRDVIESMIPAAAAEKICDSVDVYIDEGAFTLEEGRQVLDAAARAGLSRRAHVGQFTDQGGAKLLAEIKALSADHLEHVSDEGLRAMHDAGVVAVLLPGAWRTLRQTPPNAGRMRGRGVRMAIGTDCNPGTSPCTDLTLCAALAVRDAGLTLDEAVLGITANAASALGSTSIGRLQVGSHADIAIYEGDDARMLGYALGGVRAEHVVLNGELVQ